MKHYDEMRLIDEWRSQLKVGDVVRLPFGGNPDAYPEAIIVKVEEGGRIEVRYNPFPWQGFEGDRLGTQNCIPPKSWYQENPGVDAWRPR